MTAHRPRKRFGQHFLHDPGIIRRIVDAVAPQPKQALIEIGPGTGVLTEPLLAAAGILTAVEVDRDLAGALRTRLGDRGLDVVCEDVLKFDFSRADEKWRVVGNLPYNISTPLIFHLLKSAGSIADAHVMVQKEVAQRMAAAPSTADYGRLSVMLSLYTRVEILFNVGPGAFNPPPKVDSSVVRLTPHRDSPVALQSVGDFSELVRRAFAQRRKTMRRILSGTLSVEELERCGVDPMSRPEVLSLEDFARLSDAITNHT
ncbi:MAG: 16S rRNA (adenine(1518)-N(6)/adenine(1519)-N(6))-dimethyltransferase RsmA [Chromatiales bacterium]|nr:16S rRNA (adenine(1518)-N(6)/adenine(1519)-N(6))-dimethyltransferase RsmA [Chromatiales bacterium]